MNWLSCKSITEARAFIRICVYYQIWIENFAIVAQSIFVFFKKSQTFIWAESQIEAMNKLKLALTTASALVFINYFEKAGKIIIEANESKNKWENTLNQIEKEIKKRHFIHYESRFWSDMKRKYDVMKQECCVVLKMLKKCQHYL